jgi:hypothetical protein
MEGRNGRVDSSTAQRALLALDLIAGGSTVNTARAEAQVGARAIEKMRGVLKRRPDLEQPLRDGSMSLDRAMKEAGFLNKPREIALGSAFGKGDKWLEATEPLVRYLFGWQLRGMEFKHLNPREASRRLERIVQLEVLLGEAKADLERRAHKAHLSMDN